MNRVLVSFFSRICAYFSGCFLDIPSNRGFVCFKQRKKLNPDVFTYLNDEYVKDFYQAGEAELWNGYLLLAIDGSKAEVPNSQENREHFGSSGNQKASGPARAMVSCAYDILNGFYLSMEIGHITSSEIAP